MAFSSSVSVSGSRFGPGEVMRSECRPREKRFMGPVEVFVRIDCEQEQDEEEEEEERHVIDRQHVHSKVLVKATLPGGYTNGTAVGGLNSTVSRRWQRKRLSFFKA